MKVCLICIIFILCILISLINLSYYRTKNKVIEQLTDFMKYYINEIQFNKSSINEVVKTFVCGSETKKLLTSCRDKNAYPKCLSSIEVDEIYDMLESLGKRDLDGEIGCATHNIAKLDIMHKASMAMYAKSGVLRSKLILIAGLIIIIILI